MKKKLLKSVCKLILILGLSTKVFSQGYTPIRGMGVEAKAVNNNGICLACYNGSLNPVIDADLNNKVSMGNFAALVSGSGISVKNNITTYPAGYITGFNVDTGTSFITAELLSSLRIATYKNGVLRESSTNATLLTVPAFGGTKNRIFLHFKTTMDFNEVRLFQTNVLSLFSAMNVYYAFAFDPNKMVNEDNKICDDIIAGSSVDGNVSGSSSFISPLSTVINKDFISDGKKNTYGSIFLPAGLLGSYSVGLLDKDQIYPAGNKAGFVISPDDEGKLLSAEFLKNISIETYLFGQLQDSKPLSDGGGLINIKVLSFGFGKQKVSLVTTKPFNEIRLKVTQTAGVNIVTLKVYYAFEEPVKGCECDDKIQTTGSAVPGNLVTGSSWTSGPGLFGIILGKMVNPENIVDTNTSNYATATVPAASFLSIFSAYVTVKTNELQPTNTFAGFTLEKAANLIGVGILENITVTFYNNTTVTDVFTGTGSLISGNFFTTDSNKFYVGGKATKPFNRIKINFNSGSGIRFPQEYYIYNAFATRDDDNDGIPNCFEVCLSGDDSIDTDGNGIPDCKESICDVSDKSSSIDTDMDGVFNSCDIDSDNDGIPDFIENADNTPRIFEDDDKEGVDGFVTEFGDGVANYLDLDSDNDGILDLFESGIPNSVIDQIDADHNGIIDRGIAFGKNGFADILETFPDSGVPKYPIRDTDADGLPDFLDITSNGSDYDLYAIGKMNLDQLGAGFLSRTDDTDIDGIQDPVDTDLQAKGAPHSPLSPYGVSNVKKGESKSEIIKQVKVYPNPVKDNLFVDLSDTSNITVYNMNGQQVDTKLLNKGKNTINTQSWQTGIYIIKISAAGVEKTFSIIKK